jgi:hypothetical protein
MGTKREPKNTIAGWLQMCDWAMNSSDGGAAGAGFRSRSTKRRKKKGAG